MNKQRYYIAVGTGEIFNEIDGDLTFDFEVEATPQEIALLRQKFEATQEEDYDTFIDTHIPFKLYHEDQENEEYDKRLYEVYEMIYRLGTPETRQQMEQMGILQHLREENHLI